MADQIDGGFRRAARDSDGVGALIVQPPSGAVRSGAPVTGVVSDSAGAALTPKLKFANIAASATDTSVVAAVTSKKIRVLAAAFVAAGTATTITFNSASAAITCLFANAANGGAVLPFSPSGWFETVAGEALTATTGAGSATGVQLVYVEV